MNRENPDKYEVMFEEYKKESENKIQDIIDETDESAERMVNMAKVLERASAGDQNTLDQLSNINESSDQTIKDTTKFIEDKLGFSIMSSKIIRKEDIILICQEAFEAMLEEKNRLTYFRGK